MRAMPTAIFDQKFRSIGANSSNISTISPRVVTGDDIATVFNCITSTLTKHQSKHNKVMVPYFLPSTQKNGVGHWVLVVFCKDGKILYADPQGDPLKDYVDNTGRHTGRAFHFQQLLSDEKLKAMHAQIYGHSPAKVEVNDLTSHTLFQTRFQGNTCADWVLKFAEELRTQDALTRLRNMADIEDNGGWNPMALLDSKHFSIAPDKQFGVSRRDGADNGLYKRLVSEERSFNAPEYCANETKRRADTPQDFFKAPIRPLTPVQKKGSVQWKKQKGLIRHIRALQANAVSRLGWVDKVENKTGSGWQRDWVQKEYMLNQFIAEHMILFPKTKLSELRQYIIDKQSHLIKSDTSSERLKASDWQEFLSDKNLRARCLSITADSLKTEDQAWHREGKQSPGSREGKKSSGDNGFQDTLAARARGMMGH